MTDTHPRQIVLKKTKKTKKGAVYWDLRGVKLAVFQSKGLFIWKLFICLRRGGITHPTQTHVVAALLQIQWLQ